MRQALDIKQIKNLTSIAATDSIETRVQYDTTDGINLSSVNSVQYKDNTTDQYTSSIDIPIVSGNGISIDKAEDKEQIEIKTDLKTIFGNQSLYGSGNIDIYQHQLTITNEEIGVYCTFYSSKSLNIDSLTDLRTVLGNKFIIMATGSTTTKGVVFAITQSELACANGSYLLSNVTITDTVTTI